MLVPLLPLDVLPTVEMRRDGGRAAVVAVLGLLAADEVVLLRGGVGFWESGRVLVPCAEKGDVRALMADASPYGRSSSSPRTVARTSWMLRCTSSSKLSVEFLTSAYSVPSSCACTTIRQCGECVNICVFIWGGAPKTVVHWPNGVVFHTCMSGREPHSASATQRLLI